MRQFQLKVPFLLVILSFSLVSNGQIENQISSAQPANFWINGVGKTGNGLWLAKNGGDAVMHGIRLTNEAETRGGNFQLTAGTLPGLATWLHDGVNWVERMRILSNGYVGIGNTVPTSRLAVCDTSTTIYTPSGTGSAIPPGSIAQFYNQSLADGNGAHIIFTAINASGAKNAAYIGVVSNSGATSFTPDVVIGQRNGGSAWLERLRISAAGNVGIGITNPSQKLEVNGLVAATGTSGGLKFNSRQAGGNDYQWYSSNGMARLYDHNNTADRIIISANGNVGIGSGNPGTNKLSVDGTIGAKKVKVTQNVWADFVFEPGYALPSLREVEGYILENKHLPGIPTAKEVQEDGLDLGEMNKKLLQKVEELTLYIIEQQKRIEKLEAASK